MILSSAQLAATTGDVITNALHLDVRGGTDIVMETDNPIRALGALSLSMSF